MQRRIGGSLRIAADGTRRSSRIGAQLELAAEHVLQAVLVHRDQDQVSGLSTNLPAETAAFEANEHRCAPAAASAARGHALAILRADDECALLVVGNHHDARSAGENRLRNSLVRG